MISYAMHMHMHMQCICFEKCEFCFAGRNSVFGDYSEEEEGEEEAEVRERARIEEVLR